MWAHVVVGDSSAGPSLVLVPRLQQLDEENSELRSCTPCLKANIERLEEVSCPPAPCAPPGVPAGCRDLRQGLQVEGATWLAVTWGPWAERASTGGAWPSLCQKVSSPAWLLRVLGPGKLNLD